VQRGRKGDVDVRWGRSPKHFLTVLLTKFFNGALRVLPQKGMLENTRMVVGTRGMLSPK